MITDFLINVGYTTWMWVANWAGLTSSSGLPAYVHDGIRLMGAYLDMFSAWLPYPLMASLLLVSYSKDIILFSIKLGKWIYSWIPFVGGSSK